MADSSALLRDTTLYSQAVLRQMGRWVVATHRSVECETLQLWAEGDSVNEIAAKTGRKKTSIYRHLKTAREALGARNNRHLAALAVAFGIADLDDQIR